MPPAASLSSSSSAARQSQSLRQTLLTRTETRCSKKPRVEASQEGTAPTSGSDVHSCSPASGDGDSSFRSQARHILKAQGNDSDNAIVISDTNNNDNVLGPVPFEKFLEMWEAVEDDDGWSTEHFEDSKSFRKANSRTDPSDTKGQAKAQYGRFMFKATKVLFEQVVKLKYYHRFLDVGHGVGNMVLQAAYTVGCEALGIEVVGIRHERALVYEQKLGEVDDLLNRKRDGKNYLVGPVRMRHGSLEALEHRNFLTQDVDVAFCNNYGEVFGARSSRIKQAYSMDDYLAGLFCLMKPGAVMITLHPLVLGFSRDEANAIRSLHELEESEQASFYKEEQYEFTGKDLLSWTDNKFKVYKYTRLANSSFLCCNPNCDKAKNCVPIQSYKEEDGRVLVNRCDCLIERRTRRPAKYQVSVVRLNVE